MFSNVLYISCFYPQVIGAKGLVYLHGKNILESESNLWQALTDEEKTFVVEMLRRLQGPVKGGLLFVFIAKTSFLLVVLSPQQQLQGTAAAMTELALLSPVGFSFFFCFV